MKSNSIKNIISIFMLLPCVVLGIIIMALQHVPFITYSQNILVLIFGYALSFIYIYGQKKFSLDTIWVLGGLILFLLAPFMFSGVEGVHRWLKIGPFSINAGFIIIPMLLIVLNKLLKKQKENLAVVSILLVTLILFLQPDASMVSAFSISSIVLLYRSSMNKIKLYILGSILLITSFFSWIFIDNLPPVTYVEGIIDLAKQMGTIYFILSIITLLIALIPFYFLATKKQMNISMSLGIFYLVLICSSLLGQFPVPLLGYGVSPIISYLISLSFLIKNIPAEEG